MKLLELIEFEEVDGGAGDPKKAFSEAPVEGDGLVAIQVRYQSYNSENARFCDVHPLPIDRGTSLPRSWGLSTYHTVPCSCSKS